MQVTLRKKPISNGKKYSLYLDVTGQGRHKEYLKLRIYAKPKDYMEKRHNEETMRQAEDKRSTRQLELQAQNIGLKYIPPTKQTFNEFFEEYIKDYAKKDIRKFEGAFKKYVEFNGPKPFFLTKKWLDNFKIHLSEKAGLQGETPVMYLSKFKRVCIAAHKKRIVKVDPLDSDFDWKLSFDRHALRKEVLSAEELKLLSDTPCGNEDLKRLFLFCCNTGLRFGDAKDLTWGKIAGWKVRIEQGKTGRYLYAEMNNKARLHAGTPGAKGDLVFPGVKSIHSALRVLKTWYENAKIDKHISTHCARHTFCTNLMQNKVNTKTIISLMGWSEESGMRNLMRYAHLVDESLKAAVHGLPDY